MNIICSGLLLISFIQPATHQNPLRCQSERQDDKTDLFISPCLHGASDYTRKIVSDRQLHKEICHYRCDVLWREHLNVKKAQNSWRLTQGRGHPGVSEDMITKQHSLSCKEVTRLSSVQNLSFYCSQRLQYFNYQMRWITLRFV